MEKPWVFLRMPIMGDPVQLEGLAKSFPGSGSFSVMGGTEG